MIKTKSGKTNKKCPHCRSSKLYQAEGKGFFCKNCGFVNKKRYGTKNEIGKVSYVTYSRK